MSLNKEETEVKKLKGIRSDFENKLMQTLKGKDPMLKIKVLNTVSDLFNQLDEPELPVIPKFVADYYESLNWWERQETENISWLLSAVFGSDYHPADDETDRFAKWVRENVEDYIDMVRYGYEVEEEPKYYAKIKGHEYIEGVSQRCYWVYREGNPNVQPYLEISYKVLAKNNPKTINEWNDLEINKNNADFEEVDGNG